MAILFISFLSCLLFIFSWNTDIVFIGGCVDSLLFIYGLYGARHFVGSCSVVIVLFKGGCDAIKVCFYEWDGYGVEISFSTPYIAAKSFHPIVKNQYHQSVQKVILEDPTLNFSMIACVLKCIICSLSHL